MPAPMLVQFEKEIDREIAKEVGGDEANDADDADDYDEEEDAGVEYGPHAQIVTNDLRSLDEMVSRELTRCLTEENDDVPSRVLRCLRLLFHAFKRARQKFGVLELHANR